MDMTTPSAGPTGTRTDARTRWAAMRPWLGTAIRLVLAVVFAYAAWTKVRNLAASGRAVAAYDVMPYDMAKVVGAALPFVELMVAALLVLGLATRVAGIVLSGLLVVFIAGISSAWARGLSIDCGCFGGDGSLAPGASPNYLPEILRDVGLLVLALYLVFFPRTRLSLDAQLLGSEDSE